MSLEGLFLDWLRSGPMSLREIKEALADVPGISELTISYAPNGDQILSLSDRSVQVGPMASNEEIRQALLIPAVPTLNTKVTIRPMKLQGLASQLSKLRHDLEYEAGQVATRIEGVVARAPGVFSGAHSTVGGLEDHLNDVETAMKDIEAVTNGGPPLEQ